MAQMYMTDEADCFQPLEIPVDGGGVGRRRTTRARRQFLGGLRRLGGKESLQEQAPRGRDAKSSFTNCRDSLINVAGDDWRSWVARCHEQTPTRNCKSIAVDTIPHGAALSSTRGMPSLVRWRLWVA